jgi:hypothetical protein
MEKRDMILQGVSLLLRATFSALERFQEIYYKTLCEDTNRWFEKYDRLKRESLETK